MESVAAENGVLDTFGRVYYKNVFRSKNFYKNLYLSQKRY